jgi:hypothetical protein
VPVLVPVRRQTRFRSVTIQRTAPSSNAASVTHDRIPSHVRLSPRASESTGLDTAVFLRVLGIIESVTQWTAGFRQQSTTAKSSGASDLHDFALDLPVTREHAASGGP